jgi:hypothetical protein
MGISTHRPPTLRPVIHRISPPFQKFLERIFGYPFRAIVNVV